MAGLQPGAIPANQMDKRAWDRWCRQQFANPSAFTSAFRTVSVDSTSYNVSVNGEYANILLVDDDTAGGAVTLTLPAASTATNVVFWIKKIGSTGNVTVDAVGSQTIDGALTAVLTAQYEAITVVSDGGSWYIL